jgi:hypothetical protein
MTMQILALRPLNAPATLTVHLPAFRWLLVVLDMRFT